MKIIDVWVGILFMGIAWFTVTYSDILYGKSLWQDVNDMYQQPGIVFMLGRWVTIASVYGILAALNMYLVVMILTYPCHLVLSIGLKSTMVSLGIAILFLSMVGFTFHYSDLLYGKDTWLRVQSVDIRPRDGMVHTMSFWLHVFIVYGLLTTLNIGMVFVVISPILNLLQTPPKKTSPFTSKGNKEQ